MLQLKSPKVFNPVTTRHLAVPRKWDCWHHCLTHTNLASHVIIEFTLFLIFRKIIHCPVSCKISYCEDKDVCYCCIALRWDCMLLLI